MTAEIASAPAGSERDPCGVFARPGCYANGHTPEGPAYERRWAEAHPWPRFGRVVKRAVDIVGACCALALAAPLFLVVAVAVLVTSGRPILYRWEVLGRNARPFTGYKFRTMVRDADVLRPQLLSRNEMHGPVFKLRDDPRVTRLGRILRKYSLDEIPQFWSVLRGDMSLVGPRPPSQAEYDEFENWHKAKLDVKPGLTCLWQVSGRNEITRFEEWAQLDLRYIREWSFWLDLKILARTVPAVVLGRGAW